MTNRLATPRSVHPRRALLPLALLAALAPAAAAHAQDATRVIPPSGVIGTRDEMLTPDYWIARAPSPDTVLLTPAEVDARNRQTFATDPNFHDLSRLAPTVSRERILAWIKESGTLPATPPVDAANRPIPAATLAAITANTAADAIPASVTVRYGMALRRAQLRTLPTALRAFPGKDLTDFEVFQGGTLFPGDPVAILHTSRDREWLLVLSEQGPVWVRPADIAEGSAAEILSYRQRGAGRVVTGDKVLTVFTPEAPALSELQLDMGTRVPLADLPPDQPVNGEGPYQSWTVLLPERGADGRLHFAPALVPKTRDTAPDYLPLTRANIIRQAFKFLGERYGWGHLYNSRDCSGFTSDTYHSMGVILPANSGQQGQTPAVRHQLFTAADGHEARVAAVMAADIGDLIVVPGHVLMILGKVDGQPYVIQDVPYAVFREPSGKLRMTKTNQVSVTPLLPLLATPDQSYVDAMTSLVHVTAR